VRGAYFFLAFSLRAERSTQFEASSAALWSADFFFPSSTTGVAILTAAIRPTGDLARRLGCLRAGETEGLFLRAGLAAGLLEDFFVVLAFFGAGLLERVGDRPRFLAASFLGASFLGAASFFPAAFLAPLGAGLLEEDFLGAGLLEEAFLVVFLGGGLLDTDFFGTGLFEVAFLVVFFDADGERDRSVVFFGGMETE
jgi:hypothetical protein